MITATAKKRLERIKEWATDNYEKGGSYITETMNNADILAQFPTITSAQQYCRSMHEREQDIRNA